jgi:transketolase
MGVAEQNLVCTAAGLAMGGFIPFVSTFTIFATGRAWEMVRLSVCYQNLSVKICSTHAGLTVGEDGASHQTVEDIATMRVIPNMRVIVPADAVETRQAVRLAAETKGPFFIRLSRVATPVIYDENYKFELGKGDVIQEGTDVTIVACGLMTVHAIRAAEILKEKGVSAAVINMATVKPIDRELLVKWAKKTGRIVTAEEHSVIGGLGSAVSEVLSEECPVPVKKVGVQDQFGLSGSASDLLEHYKLMPSDIAEAAVKLCK